MTVSIAAETAAAESAAGSASPRAMVLGEALVVLVQSDPGPLEAAARFDRALGGAEVNVGIGLAGQGFPVSAVTRVGDDGFGRYILGELARHGVDVDAIEVDPERPTGMYVKEVGGGTGAATDLGIGASRMHYYRAGSAASALSADTLRSSAVRRMLGESALVHTSGITPALSDSSRDAMTALFGPERPDALLSFDLNWRPSLWRGRESEARELLAGYLRRADIALLGAPEARAVLGTSDPEELRHAFPEPRWLIVKNDANAVTAFDGTDREDVPALVVEVVESIGAGDAFAAGFLGGVLRGGSLRECVEAAHRTAVRALASSGDHIGVVVGGAAVADPAGTEP